MRIVRVTVIRRVNNSVNRNHAMSNSRMLMSEVLLHHI